MKKTLVMTIVLALLLSVVSVVSAATSTAVATPANVKAGETVKVTITFSEAMEMGTFKLNYNKDVLTYKSVEPAEMTDKEETDDGMSIDWFVTDPTTTITVTFEAKADGETTVEFAPVANSFGDDKTEVDVTGATTEKVVVGEVTPTPSESPDTTPTPSESPDTTPTPSETPDVSPEPSNTPDEPSKEPGNTQTPDESTKPAEDNKDEKPSKYDQTGLNVIAIALPVLALITFAGIVIAKKEN